MKARILAVIALLFVSASVFAQGTATFTLTETFINQTYRVTNPPRTTIANVSVDLQVGQVVINSDLTVRRTNTTYATSTTMIPSVTNGDVAWTVTSVIANGAPASQDVVNIINTAIASSWRVYFRNQTGDRLQSITIDDTQIVYAFSNTTGANPNITVNETGTTVFLTEADVNAYLTPRGTVTAISADLQPNQVVLNATINTTRLGVVSASATLTPTLADGKVTWTVSNVTVNGAPATGNSQTSVQNAVSGVWRTYWTRNHGNRVVTSLTITDTDMTYTSTR